MKTDWAARLHEITQEDRALWDEGTAFAGIDEAGRGPLAGPVAAACVIMPPEPLILRVDDSKRLSEARREALYEQILSTAVYAKVALASPEEIDRINILQATRKAMAEAASGAPCGLFLIDGNVLPPLSGEGRCVVHGDARCYSIAAASILAKVTRDRLMRALDEQYPVYGFARHKGYGTAEHIAALRAYGPCPAHRRSFIGRFVQEA